ncbi:MAG: NAD(P)-dependent oxidoreductase, partial [Methanobrevibacter sp.]|nr:NAD(P)-dependent oxidoreductase [Methanobrevibacter sp.]
YTKATSAILIETFDIANSLNLEDELLDTIALTEGDNFKSSAKSRIENTKNNSQRKKEELLEIIEYFENHDLEMSKATLKKLSNL